MTNYTCLIIEDDELAVRDLQRQLNQVPLLKQIDVCGSTNEALAYLVKQSYDLVFLDIKLPGQSGLDWLRTLTNYPPLIITTAYAEFAVDCYDFNVADFLLKPFTPERLQRAINRALMGQSAQRPREETRDIFLYVNRQLQKFNFDDIKYLEAYGAYTKIYTQSDVLVICESISALEERLPARQFMRIQKSFIINLAKLTALERRFAWLTDIKLPIGKNYHDLLNQLVNPQKWRKNGLVES
jgi:DNA-binding LytR/AlgR family response regulator